MPCVMVKIIATQQVRHKNEVRTARYTLSSDTLTAELRALKWKWLHVPILPTGRNVHATVIAAVHNVSQTKCMRKQTDLIPDSSLFLCL
jgi:hypothetical protein